MTKIKIVEVPPGFAPEYIRKQWIGVEIPLAKDPIPEGQEVLRIGNQNSGGYQVTGIDAVAALLKDCKFEAVAFWKPYASGNFTFKKEVCELIS